MFHIIHFLKKYSGCIPLYSKRKNEKSATKKLNTQLNRGYDTVNDTGSQIGGRSAHVYVWIPETRSIVTV